jgi:Na+-transporting methylmalonyl-CoA/oxaloacetate decarboxylase gamma subunit
LGLIGITLTFLALGLVILAMVVLERVFRATPADERPPATGLDSAADQGDVPAEEVAAAIAVALAVAGPRRAQGAGLGAVLGQRRSPWWYARVRAQPRQRRTGLIPGSAL